MLILIIINCGLRSSNLLSCCLLAHQYSKILDRFICASVKFLKILAACIGTGWATVAQIACSLIAITVVAPTRTDGRRRHGKVRGLLVAGYCVQYSNENASRQSCVVDRPTADGRTTSPAGTTNRRPAVTATDPCSTCADLSLFAVAMTVLFQPRALSTR